MGLKDFLRSFSKKTETKSNVVTREIDGFTFSFPKKEDGSVSDYSQLEIAEVTQDGCTYKLTATCISSKGQNTRVYCRAILIKYDPNLTKLVLPYSIHYKNHEYKYTANKIQIADKVFEIFPADSKIEELSIACDMGYTMDAQSKILANLTNLQKINVLPTVGPAILASTKLCYTEKQLSHSDKVYVPDGFMVCPVPIFTNEDKRRYNTETSKYEHNGFWNAYGKHIKILSLPNNFFINPGDFCLTTHTTTTQYKKVAYGEDVVREEDTRTRTSSPIKIIIIRETTDNPELFTFRFQTSKTTKMEDYKQVFGDTILYVHKKHLRTLDNKIGSSVFKAIKPLEELPEEYCFLLEEPCSH